MSKWTTKDIQEMMRFCQSHLFSLGHGRGHGPDERSTVDRHFHVWLSEVKAEAWDEGFDIGANTELGGDTNPYWGKSE